ncbi:MAG: 3-deoxy-7-phosphoheptulonate synthase [Anaerolineales bacterium]|nr:3-deoxy-7-phosphoheptulonate synthase [Anaerolineales bacterium]
MMIVMEATATKEEVDQVLTQIERLNLRSHLSDGEERTIIGVLGDIRSIEREQFMHFPGVDRVVPISCNYKLTSREFNPINTMVKVGNIYFGGTEIPIIAGPCAVENREQILESARAVKAAGAHLLRGGAYKPRTSPYSFQGLGDKGVDLLVEAREETGLPIVTEVTSPDQVERVANVVDMLQIGARNMQNFALLQAVGAVEIPVLLKRGMSSTINEFLNAAEYIVSGGNQQVILCERGIRTFETATRNTTDINAIPVLQAQTHLPVILDPSHSTGHWEYVAALARAGIAAGADGLIIEVHPDPIVAMSDGQQSLKPKRFEELVEQVKAVAIAVGRSVSSPASIVVENQTSQSVGALHV